MPIQEEERASVKPAAKARPTLKPAPTSKWDFIPDIEVQRSKDPDCFQMSKFITQLLRHKEVGRKENARVPHDRIVEKCMEILPDDSRYWSDEIKEKLSTDPYWSANNWMDVLSKGGWRTGEKVSILFENRIVQTNSCTFSSHSRPIKQSIFWKCSHQSCIARQCPVTKGFYRVRSSRRKRKGIQINSA